MKLAFCLFKYYPYGGLERDFLQIAKACFARGHDIHVFTMHWEGDIPEGFHVTFIKPSGWSNHGRAKSFAKKLSEILLNIKFDVVIGFNRLPNLDIYFAGDPCYAKEAEQKHDFLYKLFPRYRTYQTLEDSVFSKNSNTQILLLNPAHQKDFTDYYQTPKNRFTLLTPGVNEDRRRPLDQSQIRENFRKEHGIHADEKIILMIGSDFKRKGVDRALLVMSSLPAYLKSKIHLWIVGKGNAISQDRVTFWGPRDDIIKFYAAADCFLHPAYQETAGMVLIESLAAGLPIIVTQNCGYAPYIQKASAGMIIPEPFKQETLNQAVIKILTDETVLADYRQNALNFGKSHDLFHLAQQVADIIELKGKK
ncbi:MAG TPA: glycosyltransferase family 4 protein [Gammaproteobacteria bacterium]|nr:glycosyltransferase family 4 protein [Gammaproteobacteria bacterium]